MSVWLRLHGHALGDALRRMAAQPLGAAFSVLVLAVAIALPVIAAVALRSAGALTSGVETDPHVHVYLTLEATRADGKRIESALRSNPQTASVRFVSREDALAELKARTHLAEVLASLDRNPLPHAFTVRVRADDLAKLAAAREAWAKLPAVDQVVADFEWSQRLRRWIRFGDRVMAVAVVRAPRSPHGATVACGWSRAGRGKLRQLVGAGIRRAPAVPLRSSAGGPRARPGAGLGRRPGGGRVDSPYSAYATELRLFSISGRDLAGPGLCAFLGLAGAWWAVGRGFGNFLPRAGTSRLPQDTC